MAHVGDVVSVAVTGPCAETVAVSRGHGARELSAGRFLLMAPGVSHFSATMPMCAHRHCIGGVAVLGFFDVEVSGR
jgi:hypothetical protein